MFPADAPAEAAPPEPVQAVNTNAAPMSRPAPRTKLRWLDNSILHSETVTGGVAQGNPPRSLLLQPSPLTVWTTAGAVARSTRIGPPTPSGVKRMEAIRSRRIGRR